MTMLIYDAVLFDLDGVLTSTAALHALCWKRTFDDVLMRSARRRSTVAVSSTAAPMSYAGERQLRH